MFWNTSVLPVTFPLDSRVARGSGDSLHGVAGSVTGMTADMRGCGGVSGGMGCGDGRSISNVAGGVVGGQSSGAFAPKNVLFLCPRKRRSISTGISA